MVMLRALWASAAMLLLVIAGCTDIDRPDPPPLAEVHILSNGSYELDGRPVDSERLDRDLLRRAADAKNEKIGRTRLHVRITFAPGGDYSRVQALVEHCQALGIVQVETQR